MALLCSRCSLARVPAAAPSRAARAPRPLTARAAASAGEVSSDVAEARAWIAAWRAKQGKPAPASERAASPGGKKGKKGKKAAAAAPEPAPAPAPEPAPEPAPAPVQAASPLQASTTPDGTLVFTAEQLKSVDYDLKQLK